MTRRRIRAGVALLAAVFAGVGPSTASGASHDTLLRIETVPAEQGIHFVFDGATHVTGRDGSASIVATPAESVAFRNPYGLARAVKLVPVTRRDGTRYVLGRWYSKSINGRRTLIAAIRELVPTRIRFQNSQGGGLDTRRIENMVVKRSDGAIFKFTGSELVRPVVLQATRVVPLNGGLASKNLLYRIQEVTLEGNNLVNRSQQAFLPAESPNVHVTLLFYSARFSARDRIFGFAVGSGVRLQFPNGRVRTYRFGKSGSVDIAALPRGNFRVTVLASGLGRTSPVTMTRDQVATLKVFSYLDLATVVVVLLALGVGLVLIGRPAVRRRVVRALPFRGARRSGSDREAIEA